MFRRRCADGGCAWDLLAVLIGMKKHDVEWVELTAGEQASELTNDAEH